MKQFLRLLAITLLITIFLVAAEGKKKKKYSKQMILRQKETNPINFMRLAMMRIIYGVATRIGFGEQISEALNGAFVPPGADYDYYDDDDDGFLDY